jgi:hypothetical protein
MRCGSNKKIRRIIERVNVNLVGRSIVLCKHDNFARNEL